ncbi:MAG: hypothetical protein ACRDK4_10250 [Solirubrobacteraceae bacterium]
MTRIAITLDEHARAELTKRAEVAQEPVSRTAARLIRDGLLSTQTTPSGTTGSETRARSDGAKSTRNGASVASPAWVEPTGAQERWRRELWASVCALYERYPRVFAQLIEEWWTDRALIETLGALVAWRAQLDSGELADPRSELLFQDRLELLERRLGQLGDPTAPRFKGGTPPSDWIA